MIAVGVELDGEDCLRRLTVFGHAAPVGGGPGTNIVCAAVTGVVRATAEAVAGRPTMETTGAAAQPGELLVEIVKRETDDVEWLRGVTDVLKVGIERLATEHPGEVEFTISKMRR